MDYRVNGLTMEQWQEKSRNHKMSFEFMLQYIGVIDPKALLNNDKIDNLEKERILKMKNATYHNNKDETINNCLRELEEIKKETKPDYKKQSEGWKHPEFTCDNCDSQDVDTFQNFEDTLFCFKCKKLSYL
jgi:hypothetical protein